MHNYKLFLFFFEFHYKVRDFTTLGKYKDMLSVYLTMFYIYITLNKSTTL